MHIVHTISEADMPGCGAVGGSCFVAVGILFKVGNKRSDFLDTILKVRVVE